MLELKEAWVNNRHFIALPETQQKSLRAQFAYLRELAEAGSATNFYQLVVSVFDHSLSEEEAIEELNEVSFEAETSRSAKLAAFARSLASRNRCYLVKFKGRRHECPTFRSFTSDDARDRWLTPKPYNISDEWRFCLVFPELDMVYFEGCDFTHHIYLKDAKGRSVLEEAAVENELHLL